MAAPAIGAALAAFMSAFWAGLVICIKWVLEHAHIAKVITVCVLLISAYKVGLAAYTFFLNQVRFQFGQISATASTGHPSAAFAILAKANYVLPLDEALSALSAFITLCGMCMVLKVVFAAYKAIPFKAS